MPSRALVQDATSGTLLTPKQVVKGLLAFANGQAVGDTFEPGFDDSGLGDITTVYGAGLGAKDGDQSSAGIHVRGFFGDERELYSGKVLGVGTNAPSPGITVNDWNRYSLDVTVDAQPLQYDVLAVSGRRVQAYCDIRQLSGTGSQSLTGIGFEPQFLAIVDHAHPSLDSSTTHGLLSYGVCDAALNQWNASCFTDWGSDDAYSGLYPGLITANPVVGAVLEVTSMDSDGFTVTKHSDPNNNYYGILALRDDDPNGQSYFAVGSEAAASSFDINTLPNKPQALFFATTAPGTIGTTQNDLLLSFGAASEVNNVAVFAACEQVHGSLSVSRTQGFRALGYERISTAENYLDVDVWKADGFEASWSDSAQHIGWAAFVTGPDRRQQPITRYTRP